MISHLNVVDPADQPRFGQLGVTAIFQPLWACDELYMRLTIERIGPTRAGYIYPANSILKSGGRIVYGADWSVASANPLEEIEVALTRIAPGVTDLQPLIADEQVTIEQAIRAYMLDVAYVNHLDARTGSIAAGKSVDMIVLDHDISTSRRPRFPRPRFSSPCSRGARCTETWRSSPHEAWRVESPVRGA